MQNCLTLASPNMNNLTNLTPMRGQLSLTVRLVIDLIDDSATRRADDG